MTIKRDMLKPEHLAMKKPNFFIVGAPKCGTTSLAIWLSEHPQVYMPNKEIHYFSTDLKATWRPDREQYEALFSHSDSQHKALGEASVWYLYSKVAVPSIENYCEQPRYIVCLRNPVEMAYSLHEQQLIEGNENLVSFESAWELSDARLRGHEVSFLCNEPQHLAYKKVCSLGEQLERLFLIVPKERVHLVVLDDVKENPAREYQKVLQFLGLNDDGRSDFSVHNPAKSQRYPVLRKITKLLGKLKKRLGMNFRLGILIWIDRNNLQYRPRPKLSEQMRFRLQDYFREDIDKLSALLNRDLSAWVE